MNDGWLVADSVWWGPGTLTGPAALPVRGGAVTGPPVPEVAGGPVRRLPGTLLPALRDAHVHGMLVDLRSVRSGGIAAVCDLGGEPGAVARLATGGADLPAVRFAGAFLTAPGGYPSDRAWSPPGSWRVVGTPDDASAAVAEQRAAGATLIKVAMNATAGPVPSGPTLAAVVAAARGYGLPVVAHVEGPGTARAAHEAGVDVLAHTPWTERLDESLMRAMAHRMTWISTLDIHGWGTPTPGWHTAVDNLRRFLGCGGRVRYGTDLGNGPLPPGVNAREIRGLQAAGLAPEAVLSAMTGPVRPGPVCWIPAGLTLDPDRFAGCVATARVLAP